MTFVLDSEGRHVLKFDLTLGFMSSPIFILLSNHFKLKKWIKMKLTVYVEVGVSPKIMFDVNGFSCQRQK